MSKSQWQTNTMISFNHTNSPSYTLTDWNLNNRTRFQSSVNLQQSADDLLAKSNQIRDIAVEVIKTNKEETEHRLEEKIKDIEYRRKEILHNRKEVVDELDALEMYKSRLSDTLTSIKKNYLDVCEKCLKYRDQRIGIDLVHDEVEKELKKESETIKGVQNVLEKTLEEAKETIRRLKAALYFLDCDLREKNENLHKHQFNLNLKERDVDLNSVETTACNQSKITLEEWNYQTIRNIKETSKDIKHSRHMRHHIDSIIKETTTNLLLQRNLTDDEFLKRIDETRDQKIKIEIYHAEILKKAKEMQQNVLNLEKSITEKEGFLALAQTRINNQCKSSGLEVTRDPVQINLVKEIRDLNEIVAQLHQTLFKARVTLQQLLKIQVQLEEDINIKINTLKIDEVDCMTLRQNIDFHAY